jgi:hypothetical protein
VGTYGGWPVRGIILTQFCTTGVPARQSYEAVLDSGLLGVSAGGNGDRCFEKRASAFLLSLVFSVKCLAGAAP